MYIVMSCVIEVQVLKNVEMLENDGKESFKNVLYVHLVTTKLTQTP